MKAYEPQTPRLIRFEYPKSSCYGLTKMHNFDQWSVQGFDLTHKIRYLKGQW